MVGDMCGLQQHGGPDDEGIFTSGNSSVVLGHRRLSLIDLSNCGHQPMSYAQGRYHISFNGEIYNYLELRAQLVTLGFTFNSQSDTEVILAAFAAWGTDSFNKFNGMFAFAIWDEQEKNIYLVRDSAGIKPLYYAITKEGIAFASEIKAFRPIPYLQESHPHWPVFLMAYGHLPEPITILKHVKPLTKGNFLCYHVPSGKVEQQQFHRFSFSETITNRKEAISLVQDKLYHAVKRHLIADAGIGVFLSGGLDSSIIALLANREGQAKINTLSLFFEEHEFSEKKYQDLLLERLNATRNQYLLKEANFHANLPGILDAMDQPSCDGINTWYISKYAKENGLKAVLSGLGGDELFGGYPSFQRIDTVNTIGHLPSFLLNAGKYTQLKKLRRMGYLSLGGATGKYLLLRGQFIPNEIAQQLNMQEDEVWDILRSAPGCEDISSLSAGNQASWIETNLFMQNQLLRDSDVMSMVHGVEIRVPFLDKEFMELAMQIASPVKYSGDHPKQLLIDAFKDILPEPVWKRPKMGFGFPFKDWLSNNEFVKEVIGPGSKDYKRFTSGNMHWSQFLSLVMIKNHAAQFQGSAGASATGQVQKIASHTTLSPANGVEQVSIKNTLVSKKILFLTLRTFSITGGIEKVSKVAGKAMNDIAGEDGHRLQVCSMYDAQHQVDEKYIPAKIFTGYRIKKLKFIRKCVQKGLGQDIVIISHINLLLAGFLVKLLSPGTKLILIAHGIEVWQPFKGYRKYMMDKCDEVLTVSEYTKNVMQKNNHFPGVKYTVLNNCLDPYLQPPATGAKDPELMKRYHLKNDDKVLMTLTRLAAREQYKGYDIVIESLPLLHQTQPDLKYLVVGRYDNNEKMRLDELIREKGLQDHIIFTGFIEDEDMAAHFNLADIYIMPSTKEGFGIVFIEAMYYHKPVIAGNQDGSVDALLNGKLGLLINPHSKEEVITAIKDMLAAPENFLPDHKLLMDHFSYPVYKEKWRKVLEE